MEQTTCRSGLDCPNIITIEQLKIKITKLESKIKMLEISFEQINDSRNDLISQLAQQELLNEKILNKNG